MKIAITGATGGLGRSLAEFLLEQKIEVVALGRNLSAGAELAKKGATFLAGDITDVNYLKKGFAGADIVIHSAGLASPWGAWELFYHANVQGTAAVLQALRECDIHRLIYLSTPSVYFSGKPVVNISEDSPLPEATNFYSRSKILADQLVLKEVASHNLNAVLLRPRAIFGKYDTAILPRILRVMKKGFFPLPGGGKTLIDLTAVENVIHAIWLVIQSDKNFRGEIFNITNGEPMTLKNLTERLAAELNLKVRFIAVPMWLLNALAAFFETYARYISRREPPISKYAIGSMGTTQTLSIAKAQRMLGYRPVLSIDQAVRAFIEGEIKKAPTPKQ